MRIKSFVITVSASLFAVSHAFAQDIRLGLDGGLNISSMHFSPPASAFSTNVKVSNKPGFKAGLVADLKITDHIFIQTGAFYSMKGVKLSGNELELRYTYHYLEIPVLFKYSFKNIFVAAGPYIGPVFAAKVKLISVDTNLSQKIPIGNDPATDGIQRLDAGLNLKAGYALPTGLFFSLQYGFGLANVSPAVNTTENHRVFAVSIGYLFEKYTKPSQSPPLDK